jgi:hypothetical protein
LSALRLSLDKERDVIKTEKEQIEVAKASLIEQRDQVGEIQNMLSTKIEKIEKTASQRDMNFVDAEKERLDIMKQDLQSQRDEINL